MKKCYGTASFSILINGSLVDYLFNSRGLRQGDPLSPFLFLVVTKALGVILSKAFQGGLIDGFRVRKWNVNFTSTICKQHTYIL